MTVSSTFASPVELTDSRIDYLRSRMESWTHEELKALVLRLAIVSDEKHRASCDEHNARQKTRIAAMDNSDDLRRAERALDIQEAEVQARWDALLSVTYLTSN